MNEITHIHLGRQAFTIAVDAHKDLQTYLTAIKRQVGSKSPEVVREVEMRMAELLAERGVTGDKVVLNEDIDYLKQQLGEPQDFGDEDEEIDKKADNKTDNGPKRLYRDTEHGMVAGVAAGLAAYFNIDAVIVRLLFIAATITGGWGAALYVVMWIIVPEAKTNSDRLQMAGKAVTVDSIKEVVERADVPGAAKRAGHAATQMVQTVLKVLMAIIGMGIAVSGVALLLGLVTAGTYLIVHGNQVNNQVVFPVGADEIILAVCVLLVAFIIGLFMMVGGLALFNRKWTLPAWATGALLAIFLAAAGIGTALALDSVPHVSERVDKAQQYFESQDCKNNFFNYCSNQSAN